MIQSSKAFLPAFSTSYNIHHHHHHHHPHQRHDDHHHYVANSHSSSQDKLFSLCPQLQRKHNYYTLPPPLQNGDEIDPRYGVAKRLVPTGPNPLHN
ncbi:hypothetical protein MKW98_017590 [Papaver atlanticum]|uniref:Uncharacterized protein n=1 Tax=Papaver atlanticum TaxID=357466 RepID=A0AAD4XT16_9MAGN|nr:hypothetical protein MKW98_017590 [Papaver atlanticum]